MTIGTANPVSEALDRVALAIAVEGVQHVTRDPGAFHPDPVGVLVTAPTVTDLGLASISFTVPILIVSIQPPSADSLDIILTTTLQVLEAVQVSQARPTQWSGGPNLDSLPAYEVVATVTTTIN